MGLGSSRSQEQNHVEENDVPENPVLPENGNIQRHLNPEINLRRNDTGMFGIKCREISLWDKKYRFTKIDINVPLSTHMIHFCRT